MKGIALFLLTSLVVQSAALCDVPTSIFDDNWKPPAPEQVQPASPQTPPANPTPPAAATTTPTAPGPAPVPETPTPAARTTAPVVTRLAVPSSAAQADSWKLIKDDLYKDDIANAKTPAQKVELASKLLGVAEDTKNDPAGKYVLLAQAKELAISSGDPPTAFKCLDELGEAYSIDYPAMKLELFVALAKTASSSGDAQSLVEGLNRWADAQVQADRYDAARKACGIALGVARTQKIVESVNQTQLHEKQIGQIEAAYIAIKAAILILATKPDDPAANLSAGRFYCFTKGDWDKGLPMLAKGSDAKLKSLAAMELAAISGSVAQVQLGDSWWDIAEKQTGLEHDQIWKHAAKWYDETLLGLEGLARAKAEKRLKDAEALPGFGPRVINLLALVDVQRDRISGSWAVDDHGALHCDAGSHCRIEFPYQPPEEYDFRIVFTRTQGESALREICFGGGKQFNWVISGVNDTYCGFELVGGEIFNKNPTGKIAPRWLSNGQEHTSVVKVRKIGIEAYFDGKLISDWKTDFSDISCAEGWGLKSSGVTGIGSWDGSAIFRTADVVEITGKGKILTQSDNGEK